MQVYGIEIHKSDSPVRLGGPYGGQEAFLVHYEAETYPPTYTVILVNGKIETGVAHPCITAL